MFKSHSLRVAIYVFIFGSFGLLMWKDYLFNARMEEHIEEMVRSLDNAKMPTNQTRIISDSLMKIKRDISSFGNGLNTYLLLYLAIIGLMERALKKEKELKI